MQINDKLIIIIILIFTIIPLIVMDWYARMVFLARGYCRRYGHGKSWKRAHFHYKKNWTLLQRLLWIPAFKEKYESKYKYLAYQSYIGLIFAISTSIFYILCRNPLSHIYVYKIYVCFIVSGLIYNDIIAVEKGKK